MTGDYEYVEWSSENPEIASVDGNGIVRSSKLGETVITAKFVDRYGNSKKAHATVICTNTPQNSGTNTIHADDRWSVTTIDKRILIQNASPGNTYSIYNIQGQLIAQSEALSSLLSFEVYSSGVYIVKSGSIAQKVLCQ